MSRKFVLNKFNWFYVIRYVHLYNLVFFVYIVNLHKRGWYKHDSNAEKQKIKKNRNTKCDNDLVSKLRQSELWQKQRNCRLWMIIKFGSLDTKKYNHILVSGVHKVIDVFVCFQNKFHIIIWIASYAGKINRGVAPYL